MSERPTLFVEKVRRPAAVGLARDRLERLLVDPDGPGVALVVGPPGCGKTTLLARTAAASPAAAWYRAGPDDGSVDDLMLHVGYALAASLDRPELAAAGRAGTVRDLVTALDSGGLDSAPAEATLVMDDLHELAGTPAERALETLLLARPSRIRILLGSRQPPDINTSRMLVSGELRLIDAEDLRFRSWEVEELFRAVYAAPLSPESAAALTRRIGGWAAGLQLFQLATAGRSRAERERAIDSLNGRSRLIRSYLARNVLDDLSPQRLDFLLHSCTLGVLSAPLCDQLLGRTDSAEVLAELEQAQFFTTSTDGGLTYRFHQVLQTHLEVMLIDQWGSVGTRQAYGRAGALLEADQRLTAAVGAYARGEDWGSVARLLQQEPSLPVGDETWWGALALPGAPADDPGLVLAGARRLARDGQLDRSVAAYRHAEGLMDDREFRSRCRRERSAVAIWLPTSAPGRLAEGSRLDHYSELDEWQELRALTRSVRDRDGSRSALVRGLGCLLAGEPVRALAELRPAMGLSRESETLGSWRGPAVDLATEAAELLRGGRMSAARLEEIGLRADLAGLSWLSRLTRSLQAALLLNTDPAPWRFAAADELVDELSWHGEPWSTCLSALTIGAALVAVGEPGRARPLLDRAASLARDLAAPVLGVWVELARLGGTDPGDAASADLTIQAARLGVRRPLRPTPVPRLDRPAAARTSTVDLQCLGGFRLSVNGCLVEIGELRPRPRVLLMVLAVNHGKDLHREQLVDLLWPDVNLASGIRSLQVAVSNVRRCLVHAGLAETTLVRHADAYALSIPGLLDRTAAFDHDARQAMTAPASSAQLDRQLRILQDYVGDLLPEAGPAEWVLAERDRLRQLAASLGAAAARTALGLGRSADGIRAGRRSVELDPYHDPSWIALTALHEQAGDRTGAAVVRVEHARIRAELGLPTETVPNRVPARL